MNGTTVMTLEETRHERAGEVIESEQAHHEPEERFYDAVGRPRKLAGGAMKAIQREFEHGVPTRELAERYGISVSLVLTICYHTPKGKPAPIPHGGKKRPAPAEQRQVVYPYEQGANEE